MEKKKMDYEKLNSYVTELQNRMPKINIESIKKVNNLAEFLDEIKNQKETTRFDNNEIEEFKNILKYIYDEYDGTEKSIRKISKKIESPERKYDDVTSDIKILGYRKSVGQSEENKEEIDKLFRLAQYLIEVRKQRHLPMAGESDRSERARFTEILEYIDQHYDGTEESIKNICEMLESREDFDEVLSHQELENNNKEEER